MTKPNLPPKVLLAIEAEDDMYWEGQEDSALSMERAYKAGATVWAERCVKLYEALERYESIMAYDEGSDDFNIATAAEAIAAFDASLEEK